MSTPNSDYRSRGSAGVTLGMKRRAKPQPHPTPTRGGGWNLQYNADFRVWRRGVGVTKEEIPPTVGFRTITSCKRPLGL